jgi:hypothetical protein
MEVRKLKLESWKGKKKDSNGLKPNDTDSKKCKIPNDDCRMSKWRNSMCGTLPIF